jgi:Eukaryotic and archaeal DNA primase, large subunit
MNQIPVFVECGADVQRKIPFTRKHYMQPDQVDSFRWHFQNAGVYQTIMHYINPIWIQDQKGKWLINAHDSYKYGDFYLDFDTVIETEADYQRIRADVQVALRYLKVILQIDINQVQFFFSGNKGIHLLVNAEVIGLQPHQALNQIYKEMASDILKFTQHKTLDIRVYDDKRMFRMVNSVNLKSGLYKIPLTVEEFATLSYEQIKQLATQPRTIENLVPNLSPKARNAFQKYVEEWTNRLTQQKEFSGKLSALKAHPPCIKEMLKKVFRETIDERNNSGTALASFFAQQGVPRDETLHRLIAWGQENCQPILKRRDMEIIVNSVYNNSYRFGCESFKRLSGVCEKEKCPLFNKEFDVEEDADKDN